MRNITLIVILFLLNSCSLNNPFLSEELDLDKVTVVKYAPYVKHHRAYFTRTSLVPLAGKQKYRFFYHSKKRELGVLLHRKNKYLFYNFTKPEAPVLSLRTTMSYADALKVFKRQGYKTRNLQHLGYIPKVALRLYKGVKTLMIEVKDYSRLKRLYLRAIKNYNVTKIKSIKTLLPKSLIYADYKNYKNHAKTEAQKDALRFIANKLSFNSLLAKKKYFAKKVRNVTPAPKESKETQKTEKNEDEVQIKEATQDISPDIVPEKSVSIKPKKVTKTYSYYLQSASYNELRRYLVKPETSASLSYGQYKTLQKHLAVLKEEKLLNSGSLEELIAAYKVNHNPKYKALIMLLIKDKQEDQ